jgi:hypothetical protein
VGTETPPAYIVVGVAAAVFGLLWLRVIYLLLRYERRTATLISRLLSAIAWLGVSAVLVLAYVIHGSAETIRYGAVFVSGIVIVAALYANIIIPRESVRGNRVEDVPWVRRQRFRKFRRGKVERPNGSGPTR